MNKDTLEGKWREIKGNVKEKWGKLTDNDLTENQWKEREFARQNTNQIRVRKR